MAPYLLLADGILDIICQEIKGPAFYVLASILYRGPFHPKILGSQKVKVKKDIHFILTGVVVDVIYQAKKC